MIATDGAGVYKMDVDTYESIPYIVADFNRYNAMNGNTINDIYVDNEQRIWMANYPIGITVRNNRYSDYKWIKHSIGNKQSLINDQVNAIMEDEDGDLWFATNNGISLYYEHRTQQWHSFLSVYDTASHRTRAISSSLCAKSVPTSSGPAAIVPASTRSTRKSVLSTEFFTPVLFGGATIPSRQVHPFHYQRQRRLYLVGDTIT